MVQFDGLVIGFFVVIASVTFDVIFKNIVGQSSTLVVW